LANGISNVALKSPLCSDFTGPEKEKENTFGF